MKLLNLTAAAAALSVATAAPALANPATDAQQQVNQSLTVVRHMEQDPHMRALLHRAKGVLIIPRFGQGGLIVGGRGGEGVLLAHDGKRWSDPAFYNLGGVSIGAQAGGAGGSVAFILLTPQALNDLKGSNNFSFNANSGLSIVNYSAKAQAGWGKSDVVVWSDVKGAYAGATVGAEDIAADKDQNNAYYKGKALVNEILSGKLANPGATQITHALPA